MAERVSSARRIVVAIAILAISTTALPGASGAQLQLQFVRQVGGPGHADLYPWGVSAAPDGTMLITDYWNFRVMRLSRSGAVLGVVVPNTNKGTLPAQHQALYGVDADPSNGDVYVGDVDAGATVDKYTASGTFIRAIGGAGAGTGRFVYPAYVAVNSQRRLYVVDSRQPNVEVFDASGNFLFQFGTSGAGRLATPRGIAIDANDNVYINDNWNHRVAVFNAAGTFRYAFGREGPNPGDFGGGDMRGIAVDSENGWVYVVDSVKNYVNKYTLTGTYLLRFGGYGTGAGKFVEGGRGVAVDADGNVWVGDLGDFRVQKFSPSGQFLAAYPSVDAAPPTGGFNAPTDVALDEAGNIFVTDQRNQRIQKFSPSGQFLTTWGHRGGDAFGFNYPRALAVDPRNGDVIVADTDNARLKRYSGGGAFEWEAGGAGSPIGRLKSWSLDVGPDGTIYAGNSATDFIGVHVLTPGGAQIRRFGGSGSGAGKFLFPRGVALDPDGTIWVSDSRRSTGVVQHFTATGGYLGGFAAKGTAASQLRQAGDVVVDATYVYVSDTDAHQIKVFTKAGAFVGAYGGGGTAPGRMLAPLGMTMTSAGRLYVAEQTGDRVQEFRPVVI